MTWKSRRKSTKENEQRSKRARKNIKATNYVFAAVDDHQNRENMLLCEPEFEPKGRSSETLDYKNNINFQQHYVNRTKCEVDCVLLSFQSRIRYVLSFGYLETFNFCWSSSGECGNVGKGFLSLLRPPFIVVFYFEIFKIPWQNFRKIMSKDLVFLFDLYFYNVF